MDHPTDMLGILYSPVLRLMRLFTRTTPPALHVARPTSTTVAFTVMTRPPAITLSQKLQLYFWYLLRTCLGVFILSLLWAKGRMCYPLPLEDGLEQLLWESRVGWGLRSAVKAVDVRLLVAFGVLGLWAVVRRGYTGTLQYCTCGSRLTVPRGVLACPEWSGDPNVLVIADIPLHCYDSLHPYSLHSRHFYP